MPLLSRLLTVCWGSLRCVFCVWQISPSCDDQGSVEEGGALDCVMFYAGKLSTAAARKSAAEVNAEELQQSETTVDLSMMHSKDMLSS